MPHNELFTFFPLQRHPQRGHIRHSLRRANRLAAVRRNIRPAYSHHSRRCHAIMPDSSGHASCRHQERDQNAQKTRRSSQPRRERHMAAKACHGCSAPGSGRSALPRSGWISLKRGREGERTHTGIKRIQLVPELNEELSPFVVVAHFNEARVVFLLVAYSLQ